MKEIRKTILEEVLDKGVLMALGTVDEGGVWVSYVHYYYDNDLNVYWLSLEDTRHSRAISNNQNVSGTISVNHHAKEPNVAIQFAGKAEKLSGEIPDALKKRTPRPGQVWYHLKPQFIELIYEPFYGFEKQKLNLE